MMAKRDTIGPGEAAARIRRNRIAGTTALLMAAGGVIGLLTVLGQHDIRDGLSGTLHPAAAIAAAAILVVSIVYGSWRYFRTVDEVERRDNYLANSIGLYFYMLGYAGWYLLWRGQLVPEPSHELLFGATFTVTMIAYFWKKLRP